MPVQTTRPQLAYLGQQLDELKKKGTYFKLRVLDDEQAPECTFDGKHVINLASNNYLGLTTHPKLREAAIEATKKYGVLLTMPQSHLALMSQGEVSVE